MKTRRLTRRLALGSLGAASLSPALRGEMKPGDHHAPPALDLSPALVPAFTLDLELASLQTAVLWPGRWALVTGGSLKGSQWNATVTTGHVDCVVNGSGATEIVSRVTLATTLGQSLELRQRAVAAVEGNAVTPVNLHCEISGHGAQGEPWPALFIGRLDASALADGRLRSMVFEVV